MKNLVLAAASLLLFVPCAVAQDAPPPPAAGQPGPPMAYAHGGDRRTPRATRGPGDARMEMHDHERFNGPGGMMMSTWWKNPEMAQRLALTPDQTKRIDDLFVQSKVKLIHMHASLEEEEFLLGPLMDANPVDQAKAGAQIDKIADTRAELEKTNAKMLLGIRAVLSAEQWTKLHERHERPHGEGARGEGARGGERGPRGPHGPGGPDAKAPGAPPAE
ncbi:MAG: Spy/CpxP family protein refolding chaperone [Acidobacteriota bacterium]